MPSWLADGTIGGFIRITDITGTRPAVASYDTYGYKLASAGVVNLNGVTRFQYDITDYTDVYAGAKINITPADVATYPGRIFTTSYFIAPASAVPTTPTIAQIIAAATDVARAQNAPEGPPAVYFRTTSGDISTAIFKPASQAWAPNTKMWVAVVPTQVASMASTPSIANDLPIGSANTNGRAVSLWTNRTPAAPTILTPGAQTSTFAGTEITLAFRPNDPDKVSSFPGDTRPPDFDDLAGVQIQYAPKPTVDNPTPTWIDLPISNTLGTITNRGWYIKRSVTEPANDGAKAFWETYSIKIRCGSQSLTPGTGNLPSGNWQVRVRTFDFGHPMPSTLVPVVFPVNQSDGLYTPDTYPAVNTSPWSTPVNISVSAQVPPPVPLSPINSVAIPSTVPITLAWQYRNTYVPPFAQAERAVDLRLVGAPLWTEYESATASPTLDVGLLPPGHYEWRVQTRDTNGVWSFYSPVVRFWVVAAPQSGEVKPIPSETIDGATLGCGTHRVEIFRRGGLNRVGELTQISYVDYGRVRDDISTSKIVISGWDVDCGELLANLQTWAYEVVITRENGYSSDRVWEGPITLLTYEVDKVTIESKDVIGYAYRRIIKQAMSDTKNGATVTARAAQVVQNAFAPDDPNVLAYLNVLSQPDDAMQYRSTPAYARTAFEEIDDMAANAGLDYTVVGRSILLWSTRNKIGTLPEFRDVDLGSPPIVSEYGMNMANVYAISDGNGIWGQATRGLDVSGNDPIYGLVEMLSSTWATDSADETGTYTQEGVATVVESFEESAERSIASRYPPPVIVRVPDNTTLNPGTVLSIQHLVPGVAIPLRSTGTLRTVVAMQKLDSMRVVEQNGKETISITLSPFAAAEVEEEE